MFTPLELRIIAAATAYYEGNEIMTDDAFDLLIEKQKATDKNSPVLQVGWGYVPESREVAHVGQKVGSLSKIQFSEMAEWDETSEFFTVQPKFDGASVVVYFVNHEIHRAATRGDGKIGRDVTAKMKILMPAMVDPSKFPYDSIRGEVVVPRKYEETVLKIPKDDGTFYTTTRGFASGVLGQLETRPELLCYLEFVPYTIRNTTLTKSAMFAVLYQQGLIPNSSHWTDLMNTKEEVGQFYEYWNKVYPIDGVVISPRLSLNPEVDSYSVKFATEEVEGTVLHIEWNTGSTGELIPVIVLLKPVLCCGAMLGRMTGHYAGWIAQRGIDTGAVITLTRANEVIPKITGVITPSTTMLPGSCPTCGADTEMFNYAFLMCTNDFCPAKTMEQAYKLVETAKIDKGIGKDTWFRFFDLAGVKNFSDFVGYLRNLNEGGERDERPIDWFGKVKGAQIVDNALPAVWKKVQEITYADILFCMNIPDLGRTHAERLGIYTFLELKDIGICADLNFGTTVTIGGRVAEKIMELISMVTDLHLYPGRHDEPDGTEVCVTGKLEYGTREAFAAEILKFGFINKKTITKNTKFLICNENKASSKTKAAEKNGTEVVTEEQFLNMHNIKL